MMMKKFKLMVWLWIMTWLWLCESMKDFKEDQLINTVKGLKIAEKDKKEIIEFMKGMKGLNFEKDTLKGFLTSQFTSLNESSAMLILNSCDGKRTQSNKVGIEKKSEEEKLVAVVPFEWSCEKCTLINSSEFEVCVAWVFGRQLHHKIQNQTITCSEIFL